VTWFRGKEAPPIKRPPCQHRPRRPERRVL
jgi:hypothetical protein